MPAVATRKSVVTQLPLKLLPPVSLALLAGSLLLAGPPEAVAATIGYYEVGDSSPAPAPDRVYPSYFTPRFNLGGAVEVGSVPDSEGAGNAAWGVRVTNQLPAFEEAVYMAWLSNGFIAEANQQGWWYRERIRFPEGNSSINTGLSVYLGGKAYVAYFQVNDDNNLQASLLLPGAGGGAVSQIVALTSDGSGKDYHTYELRGDAGGGAGSLYFDGQLMETWSPLSMGLGHGDVFKAGNEGPSSPSEWNIRMLAYGAGTPPEDSPADLNLDGSVDALDLQQWGNGFGASGNDPQGDINGDSRTDGADFLSLQRQAGWSLFNGPGAVNVPEPSGGMLALLACFLWLGLCRRG